MTPLLLWERYEIPITPEMTGKLPAHTSDGRTCQQAFAAAQSAMTLLAVRNGLGEREKLIEKNTMGEARKVLPGPAEPIRSRLIWILVLIPGLLL